MSGVAAPFDPTAHPVARLLRERAEAGSRPGAREDAHCVALVLEGGGMRGVVSIGMAAALERLRLADCFDLVVGSSAGAINGAALLAGEAVRAAEAYCGPLASRQFVNPMRVFRGKPVIDVNDVLKIVTGVDVAGHERMVEGADPALHRHRRGLGRGASTCTAWARSRRSGTRSWRRAGCRGPAGRRSRSTGAATSTAA